MGERKVINKYYPPEFDHSKLPRRKRSHDWQLKIRNMLPIRIQCKHCGNYMTEGSKFNSRKEIAFGKTYLGTKAIRFYLNCRNCLSETVFETDPQNSGYVVDSGARQCYVSEEFDDDEEDAVRDKDSMEELEKKAQGLKREMEMVNTLNELQSLKSMHETVSFNDMFRALEEKKKKEKLLEQEDEEHINFHRKQNFIRRICNDDDDDFEMCLKRKRTVGSCYSGKVKMPESLGIRFSVRAKPNLISNVRNMTSQEEGKGDVTGSGLDSLWQSYQSDED